MSELLQDLVRAAAKEFPSNIAFTDGTTSISYRQLDTKSRHLKIGWHRCTRRPGHAGRRSAKLDQELRYPFLADQSQEEARVAADPRDT